jgi:NTE family protein
MGADVVIAVELGTPLMKREELTSVLGVTGQMINILTEQNVGSLASLKPTTS